MATSEAQKLANKKYRESNPEAQRRSNLKYCKAHREEAKLTTRLFNQNNPTHKALYCIANIEMKRENDRKYRARVNSFKREYLRLANIDV